MHSLPGSIYQLKLLMLPLKRGMDLNYSFYLGTEIEEAGKFDDLVLEITKEDNQKEYRLFQSKHKDTKTESEKIKFSNLLTEKNGSFLLGKYFHSYFDAKNENLFKEGKIKDVTVCTNIDFDFENIFQTSNGLIRIKDTVKKIENEDNILNIKSEILTKESARYRFNQKIIQILKSPLLEYTRPKLAEKLATCFFKKEPIDHCKDTLFKIYHGVLAKEVIDTNNKEFFVKFLAESSDVLVETSRFREMFKKEISKKSRKIDFNKINYKVLKRKYALNLSSGFGEGNGYDWSIPLEYINGFLDHLVFAVNLPNEKELGIIIQNEIGKEFNFAATEYMFNNFFIYVLDWAKGKGKRFINNEDGKELFDKSKKTLCTLGLSGFTREFQTIIEKYNISFKLGATQALQLREFLSQDEPSTQIFSIITKQNILSSVKVCEILAGIPEYKKDFSYIFMNIDNVLNLQDDVVQTFEESNINLCIISCNLYKRDTINLYIHLRRIILKNINKKLVLIARENDPLANNFKCDSFMKEKFKDKRDDRNTLIDLSSESQEKLLVESKVTFQEKEIILGSLIDEESKHLIQDDELFNLINGEKLEIRNSFPNLGDNECYYIPRRFYRYEVIAEEFTNFSSYVDEHILNMNNTFLITYNSEDINLYLNEGLDVVLISASEYCFNMLCDKYKGKKINIHWLKKEDRVFVWQQTHGSFSKLRRFLNCEKRRTYEPQNVLNITDKTVIISAEAGEGKSTVLTFLAEQTKRSDPALWVETIDLLKCTTLLENVKNENFDNNEAINFLLEIVNLNTSLEKNLFKHRVNQRGKIVLLFDAFDEISPLYKKTVFNLLKTLREGTKIECIWITTRPHLRTEVEEYFGVLSYFLWPLWKLEQENFLEKYLRKALDSSTVNENRLGDYTAGLLRLLSVTTDIVDNRKKIFCGVPLHLRMLADVFVEDFKEYHDSNENKPNLQKELDLIDLYELFIKKKFDFYWKEKNKRDETKPSTKEDYEKLYRLFISDHKIVAFTMLFSHHNILDILSAEEKEKDKRFREAVKKGEERTGIVSIVNETICFSHRSFAEYFAVEFISAKLKSNCSTENVWSFLISTCFIEAYCSKVRLFFNVKIEKDPELSNLFFESITKETVIKLLESSNLIKLISIAACENLANILNFLLKFAKEDLDICDKISNSNILVFVASKDNNAVAEILLSYVKDTDITQLDKILNVDIENFRNDDSPSVLIHVFKKFYEYLAKSMEEKYFDHYADADDKNIYFYYDSPPLHTAVKKNNKIMIDILLKYVEDNEQLQNILNFSDLADCTALYYAVERRYFDDKDYVLFKYIKKLNPDQRYDVICGKDMMTDSLGRPSGPQTSPMYTAAELADFKDIDPQYKHLSSFIKNVSELNLNIEFLTTMIKEDSYQTKCIRSVLEKLCSEQQETANAYELEFVNLGELDYFSVNAAVPDGEGGKTLLHLACESALIYQPPYIDLIKCFVDAGANVNVSDNHGATPLHLAAGVENGFKVVEYLVTKGADVNSSDSQGATPLHLAVGAKNGFKVVEYLVTQGADVNSPDSQGATSLHLAAGADNGLNVVEYLVTEGADFKLVDGDRRTPLHYAAQHDKLEVVKYLVEKGADFTGIDKYGKTPLNLVEEKGYQRIINFLSVRYPKSDVDRSRLQTSHNKYDFKQQKFLRKRRYDDT